MAGWMTTWGSIVSTTQNCFRRHWQRALLIRERLRFSEEAFHLLLAAGVGVLGGLTNWAYWGCNTLLQWIALRLIGNPGLTNLLEAVVAGDGRLPLRTALVSAASSLLSISTGASIGREGLIILMSATFASKGG